MEQEGHKSRNNKTSQNVARNILHFPRQANTHESRKIDRLEFEVAQTPPFSPSVLRVFQKDPWPNAEQEQAALQLHAK